MRHKNWEFSVSQNEMGWIEWIPVSLDPTNDINESHFWGCSSILQILPRDRALRSLVSLASLLLLLLRNETESTLYLPRKFFSTRVSTRGLTFLSRRKSTRCEKTFLQAYLRPSSVALNRSRERALSQRSMYPIRIREKKMHASLLHRIVPPANTRDKESSQAQSKVANLNCEKLSNPPLLPRLVGTVPSRSSSFLRNVRAARNEIHSGDKRRQKGWPFVKQSSRASARFYSRGHIYSVRKSCFARQPRFTTAGTWDPRSSTHGIDDFVESFTRIVHINSSRTTTPMLQRDFFYRMFRSWCARLPLTVSFGRANTSVRVLLLWGLVKEFHDERSLYRAKGFS